MTIKPKSPAMPPRPTEDLTSLSLLQRARDNNQEAWRQLVELYRPRVLRWCSRARLHGPDAEDVSQEVFAAVAVGLARFHHHRPGDTFGGWLRVITRNEAVQHHRRQGRQPRAEGGAKADQQLCRFPDPQAGPSDPEEEAEITGLYLRILERVRCQFEPHTWQAFWRTVVDGREANALAAELGRSAASIRQAKSRVLRCIRRQMGELLD
jgi:RNA polymerase sigma-70 factor (ECF subfamily)